MLLIKNKKLVFSLLAMSILPVFIVSCSTATSKTDVFPSKNTPILKKENKNDTPINKQNEIKEKIELPFIKIDENVQQPLLRSSYFTGLEMIGESTNAKYFINEQEGQFTKIISFIILDYESLNSIFDNITKNFLDQKVKNWRDPEIVWNPEWDLIWITFMKYLDSKFNKQWFNDNFLVIHSVETPLSDIFVDGYGAKSIQKGSNDITFNYGIRDGFNYQANDDSQLWWSYDAGEIWSPDWTEDNFDILKKSRVIIRKIEAKTSKYDHNLYYAFKKADFSDLNNLKITAKWGRYSINKV